MKAKATEWIGTDRQAIEADIERLGVHEAAAYQMDLIADRALNGDDRWSEITLADMQAALADMVEG